MMRMGTCCFMCLLSRIMAACPGVPVMSKLRAREVASYKKDPADFVVGNHQMMMSRVGQPRGRGRPGWHIECSAMSEKHLGLPLISMVAARI